MIGQRSASLEQARPAELRPLKWSLSSAADRAFEWLATAFGVAIVLLAIIIFWQLWTGSEATRQAYGLSFIMGTTWDPVHAIYGAAPFIYGTLMTSFLALLLAGPIGVGAAIYLTELAPTWLRVWVGFLVEMLAAIPSVCYGLWALFVLVPIVREKIEPALTKTLGFLPMFQGPAYGVGYLSAGLVLTIMILPTITAVSQAVLHTVPRGPLEGAYAVGATRWEVIRDIALPFARSGIIGALILGLGRALGETMAVTMVIGNKPAISPSVFALGHSMAAVIASQFNEAQDTLHLSALIEIGLLLFIVSAIVNYTARVIVRRMAAAPAVA